MEFKSMREILIKIFGEYKPTLGPNGEVLGGLYSIDFTWIAGVIVFCIFLWCFFRILNSAINRL